MYGLYSKRTAKFLIVLGLLLLLLPASSALAEEIGPYGLTVINVPAGDVDALYQAVYENGEPRDNVDIVLGAGTYMLDPDPGRPNGGRLFLGKNTVLRSTYEMALDENGIPIVNENDEPVPTPIGAKLDGSLLEAEIFNDRFLNSAVIVGKNGLVEKLWIDGSIFGGIEIATHGRIRMVRSTNNATGARIRPSESGGKANGTIESSLFSGNLFGGTNIFAGDQAAFSFTHATTHATVTRNRILSSDPNGAALRVFGSFGADNNKVFVDASHNAIRSDAQSTITIFGSVDVFSPGGSFNSVKVSLSDNLIADGETGIWIVGGRLNRVSSLPLEDRQSSGNKVSVSVSGNTFENIQSNDFFVHGGRSFSGEPSGNNNKVKIKIKGGDESEVTVEAYDCYPEEDFPTCTNEAEIKFN